MMCKLPKFANLCKYAVECNKCVVCILFVPVYDKVTVFVSVYVACLYHIETPLHNTLYYMLHHCSEQSCI